MEISVAENPLCVADQKKKKKKQVGVVEHMQKIKFDLENILI